MIIKNIKQNKTGFTLVEVLVAVSVFAILAILLSVIYVAFTKMQTRTQISQQVLNDSQFTLETMTREIRNSEIYEYDPYNSSTCVDVLGAGYVNCLLMVREGGQMVAFTTTTDQKLLYITPTCNSDYSTCAWALDDYDSYTELLSRDVNNINVEDLYFYVNPSENPFDSITTNLHPVVTIRLRSTYRSTSSREQVSHLLQTTIASRVYKR